MRDDVTLRKWKTSRYTHRIGLSDGAGLLHNGYSGAIIKLSPTAYSRVCQIFDTLNNPSGSLNIKDSTQLFPHLVAGGFVVEDDVDEVALIKEQYERERKRSHFLLTILPTFECNLSCSYCFVGKKCGLMSSEVQQQIVHFVRNYLENNAIPSMNVDWLGGEPLLALNIIESLSSDFRESCENHGAQYSAQAITNGTLLDEKAIQVLQKAGVERLQITIDGPSDIHDRRRGFRKGDGSSYEAIIEGIERAIGKFQIRLRINVDRRNLGDAFVLLDEFEERRWLGPEKRFYPYLARVSPFTKACAKVVNHVCTVNDFYLTQFDWWKRLQQLSFPVAFQPLYHFPEPRPYNCGAVGANSFIFTPEGEIHKCGLAVDDSSQAIGKIGKPIDMGDPNSKQWLRYSPVDNPKCRDCSYLPTCLGGCPRNQIFRRKAQIEENCAYYRQFEDRILQYHMELYEAEFVAGNPEPT